VGREVAVARLLVDRDHHVRGEVDDLLEVLRRHVEQVPEARRDALEVPDVGDGRGELDVAHALTADRGLGDLDAAALADDALEADALVLAAGALPVAGRAEDLLAEQTVLLGLERAVVDGLGLLDLAERPTTDVVSGGQADAKLIESGGLEHWFSCVSESSQIPRVGSDLVDGRGLEPVEMLMPSSSAARKASSSVSRG
jgi:hypothetical protein